MILIKVLLNLLVLGVVSVARAKPRARNVLSTLRPGVKWEICIHEPVKHDSVKDFIPKSAIVWDIDLSHAQDYPDMIPKLKKAGKAVICYFNAGALQSWDEDFASFPKSTRGKTLGGPYTDEWYLDIRSVKVVALMKRRLNQAAEAGCDGVDPDNIDAWVDDDGVDATGFKLTPDDYTNYMITLAKHAHSLSTKAGASLFIGQKNAPLLAPDLVKHLDFAVLEECREDAFCGDFQAYVSASKPVFQIEYPSSVRKTGFLSKKDKARFCETGQKGKEDYGFSKILKGASEQLDGWGQYCDGQAFVTPTLRE